jgi:hypothetical protein
MSHLIITVDSSYPLPWKAYTQFRYRLHILHNNFDYLTIVYSVAWLLRRKSEKE